LSQAKLYKILLTNHESNSRLAWISDYSKMFYQIQCFCIFYYCLRVA